MSKRQRVAGQRDHRGTTSTSEQRRALDQCHGWVDTETVGMNPLEAPGIGERSMAGGM